MIVPYTFFLLIHHQIFLHVDHLLDSADALEWRVRHLVQPASLLVGTFLFPIVRPSEVDSRVGVVPEGVCIADFSLIIFENGSGGIGLVAVRGRLVLFLFVPHIIISTRRRKNGSVSGPELSIDQMSNFADVRHHLPRSFLLH